MGTRNNSGAFQISRRGFLQQSTLAGLTIAGSLPSVSWAVRGDQLHIRNYFDIASLDPAFSLSGGDSFVQGAIFQNLLKPKTDGTWDTELDAAEYFEAIDDTHYAFRLKRGQIFNNGFGEMTADDVKFSFERIIDPNVHSINAVEMGSVKPRGRARSIFGNHCPGVSVCRVCFRCRGELWNSSAHGGGIRRRSFQHPATVLLRSLPVQGMAG